METMERADGTMSPHRDSETSRSSRRWALGLASVAPFVVSLDLLVITTALDTIRRDLGESISSLQWALTAYSLTFAVLLLTGAALGDRLGRRRMFTVGLGIFVVGSAGAALSTNLGMLIAARAVEGAGAAIIIPLALTIVSTAYPAERRGAAIGILEAVAGLAVIAGPLVGGVIASLRRSCCRHRCTARCSSWLSTSRTGSATIHWEPVSGWCRGRPRFRRRSRRWRACRPDR